MCSWISVCVCASVSASCKGSKEAHQNHLSANIRPAAIPVLRPLRRLCCRSPVLVRVPLSRALAGLVTVLLLAVTVPPPSSQPFTGFCTGSLVFFFSNRCPAVYRMTLRRIELLVVCLRRAAVRFPRDFKRVVLLLSLIRCAPLFQALI